MFELIPFKYRYKFDQLGFLAKLIFIWKSLWFPWRRFLRFLKRCMCEIGKWLLFFVPFSIVLALGVCLCLLGGVVERDELGGILLSVVFGSLFFC